MHISRLSPPRALLVAFGTAIILCSHDCHADACPKEGSAPTGFQRVAPLQKAILLSDVEAVRRILQDTDVNQRDDWGNTPLVAALTPMERFEPSGITSPEQNRRLIANESAARRTIVSLLLDRGAAVNLPGLLGATPLMQVARWGEGDDADRLLASRLLQLGAEVNARDDFGSTALMYAAQSGKRELAALLLAHGADRTVTNCQGETAASLASYFHHPDIAMLLAR